MKILITGTAQGIGHAIAERFLKEGHAVIGIDRQKGSITHPQYTHYTCDVRDKEHLPETLNELYPEYADINITMPSEYMRRVGQSIAAASLAESLN